MKLTAQRRVMSRLRMSGAIPLLLLCTFKVSIWTTLPLPLPLPIISLWKGGRLVFCRRGSFVIFSGLHRSFSMAKSERRCHAINSIIKLKNETSNKKYYCSEVYQTQQITTLHTEYYTVRQVVICAPCTAVRLKVRRHDTQREIKTMRRDKRGTSLAKVEVHKYKFSSVHYTFSACFHKSSQRSEANGVDSTMQMLIIA
jgi:hypothetical protein